MWHTFNFLCERKIAVSYSIGRVVQVFSSKGIAFLKAVFFNQLKEVRNCLVEYLKSGLNAPPCYSFGYWQNWELNSISSCFSMLRQFLHTVLYYLEVCEFKLSKQNLSWN